MKIFLDDERIPVGEGWMVVRNYAEFTRLFAAAGADVTELSFDHDLGFREPTGNECVNWLIETALDYPQTVIGLTRIYFHTANGIGLKQMRSKIENMQRMGYFPNAELIDRSCLLFTDHAIMPSDAN